MFGALGMTAMAFAITPNLNVSAGHNLYIKGDTASWNAGVYTDGHLDWNQVNPMTDVALNVGAGPTKLFITWETRGDEAWIGDSYVHAESCQHSPAANASMQNFKIMTSANSTNGMDGDWETALEIGESGAMSRGVTIDFTGKSWFRFVSEDGVANLEEVGAFDMSNGGNDTWFFMGTSISQMGMKQFAVDTTFSDFIHAKFPAYTPAMLRGGIGCVTSSGVVKGLKYYAEYVGNVKYWAIEMGTNDAWGDDAGNNVATFKANMQTIIDTAKAHGVTPMIARMIATNPEIAKWQVNQAYLDAIDELTETNNLPKGPDFYSYFLAHPEELSTSDGVHPNETTGGGQSMHRLWAEAAAALYEEGSTPDGTIKTQNVRFAVPKVRVDGKSVAVTGVQNDVQVSVMDLMGHAVNSRNLSAGRYLVVVRGEGVSYSTSVIVK